MRLLLSCLFSFFIGGLAASAAVNEDPFPTAAGKKGLQVQMVDDALSLGIHHAGINVSMGALFDVAERPGSERFLFEGVEYWINSGYLSSLDKQIRPLSEEGVLVYLILLAYPMKEAVKDALLLHPKASGAYNIAAFNTATEEGLRLYRALVCLLAARYSGGAPEHGRVWGYIIGNEVNSQKLWYNLGRMPLNEAVDEYEQAVRAAHEVLRQHSAHARVYLSFDHHWTAQMGSAGEGDAYPAREFLDAFAALARERGDFDWHVAYHPYPEGLGNPRTWEDKTAWPTDDSPRVTFKNLEVACRHLAQPELLWQGAPRCLILSEQGIHCLKNAEGDLLQAAAFAYVWEKVRRQKGIDALIWHRHVDHAHEGGLRLGLWESKPGTICQPGQPRRIYELFRQAGTPEWEEAAAFALPITGVKSWDELAD